MPPNSEQSTFKTFFFGSVTIGRENTENCNAVLFIYIDNHIFLIPVSSSLTEWHRVNALGMKHVYPD